MFRGVVVTVTVSGKGDNDRVHGLSEGFYRDQNAPLCKRGFTRWGPTRPRDGDLSR